MRPSSSIAQRGRALASALLLLAGCATVPAPPAPPERPIAPAAPQRPPPPSAVPVPWRPLPATTPLQVVLLPSASQPIVSVRLVFRTGSVDDPRGREGLTALTTRVLVEGGTKTLTSAQLLDALYPMAAELSADTDKEFTTVAGRVHVERLPRFLALLAEVLTAPRFDPRELERLRAEQLTTLRTRLRQENDEELGKAGLDALLYEGHPYAHPVTGTEAGLAAVTLAEVEAHWRAVFTQDRLVLGLAGPVSEALATQVKASLTALPVTGAVRPPLPTAPGPRGKVLILQRDTLSTAGSFGLSIPLRRGDPGFPALFMAMSYFGEHRQEHGVLFQELRDKRGLNYGTYAYAEHYRQEGWSSIPRPNVARSQQDLTLWLRPVEAAHGVFATRGVLHFLEQLRTQPIPAERFETARGFLLGATRQWTLTAQRRLGWALDDALYGTPDFLEELRQAVATMTPAEAQAAARAALAPEHLNFAFVTRDAEGLRAALASPAPTPITYTSPKPPELLAEDQVIAATPIPLKPEQIRVLPAAEFMAR